jgi:hypothetical protein
MWLREFTLACFCDALIALQDRLVRVKEDGDSGRTHYAEVFRFAADNGQAYTVESNKYTAPAEFEVGQTVPVLYVSSEPQAARIETFWQLRGLETVTLLLGCSFPVLAVVHLRGWQQEKQKQKRGKGKRGFLSERQPRNVTAACCAVGLSPGCTWPGRRGVWDRSRWIFGA